MAKLGVNIDHVATLREARGISYPDPVEAAIVCEAAGCDSIVCHLREDRRHIKDKDLYRLKSCVKTRLNLEMSVAEDIVGIACKVSPDQATLVPEKRREITTEGGLQVVSGGRRLRNAVRRLKSSNIDVSLFIDPDTKSIRASKELGVGIIELHTGEYANARTIKEKNKQLYILKEAVRFAKTLGLTVNAGHGLNYDNVAPIKKIKGIWELNIGHSIVSYAVFSGLEKAVTKMRSLVS